MTNILNFNPMQLSNFSKVADHSASNSNVYRPRPADARSEDGVYRSVIKVIYNPHDFQASIIEQQSYNMHDDRGYFNVVSSLTNGDLSCPIFKAWKKCRYAEDGSDLHNQCDKGLFDKSFSRYVTIQVIEDKNKPELEGNYMVWKMPKAVWDIIQTKMTPAPEARKAPIPVMDFLVGRAIELEVTPGPDDPAHPERKTREIKYNTSSVTDDIMSCTNPDGSSLLTDEQQEILNTYIADMSKVWKEKDPKKRKEYLDEVNTKENTQAFSKFYTEEIIPKIQSFAPNVKEECGYKPWSEEVTARVNRWINIVLSGNDPAITTSDVSASDTIVSSINTEAVSSPTPAPVIDTNNSDMVEDDLPF